MDIRTPVCLYASEYLQASLYQLIRENSSATDTIKMYQNKLRGS
jgi:hypothetical protein